MVMIFRFDIVLINDELAPFVVARWLSCRQTATR
jgi:hypothetical protein